MPKKNLPPNPSEDSQADLEEMRTAVLELRRQNAELAASCQILETECRQYRQMVEFIPDAYLVTKADEGIEYANRAALDLFDLSTDAVEDLPLIIFVPENNRRSFKAHLGRLQVSSEVQQWEMDLRSSGGHRFPAAIAVSATGDLRAETTRLHWRIRDFTVRKLVVRSLQESEERYRMIFEHSPLGILHFDRNGIIVSCNKQLLKILGATRKKLIGFDMIQSIRDKNMHAAVAKALAGKIGYYEGDYLSVTGNKLIPLRVLFSRIVSETGEFLGGVGIFEDISERKQAEKARIELSRQRLDACNVLAHELRNALIKIGFVFPAINSVMSFLREEWEVELRKVFSNLEDKNSILMRLGELILMGQPSLVHQKELMQLSEELLAEQVIVADLYFLPPHGKNWLENKIKPKWNRLLSESKIWEKNKEEVQQLLKHLENAVWLVVDEELAAKMVHLPDDLRMQWPKLAYTEFSTSNLSLLDDVFRLLDNPSFEIHHKQQLRKLLTSLKALADITYTVEDRMNRVLSSLKGGDPEIDD